MTSRVTRISATPITVPATATVINAQKAIDNKLEKTELTFGIIKLTDCIPIIAAKELGISITWKGKGVEEKGYDANGKCIVQVDPRYFRPTEVETLLGDATKAREKLGWTPQTSFAELVREMVQSDYTAAKRDSMVKLAGFQAYDYHE